MIKLISISYYSKIVLKESKLPLYNDNGEILIYDISNNNITSLGIKGWANSYINNKLFYSYNEQNYYFDFCTGLNNLLGSKNFINEDFYFIVKFHNDNIYKDYHNTRYFYNSKDVKILELTNDHEADFKLNHDNYFISLKYKTQDIINCVDLHNPSQQWSININDFKPLVPQWQITDKPNIDGETPSDIKVHNKMLKFGDILVFTVHNPIFYDDRAMSRLVGVDMKNGSVLYVSDYNKTKSLIYKCGNKLYTQISRKIYEIEPASGKFLWEFDLNVYLHLSASDLEGGKFAGIYYHIDDEIVLVAECDKLNFFCIERSTGKVLLHHKFEKGKDASQDAYKITEPVYHQGKIFFSLHAFDAPPVFYVYDIEEDGLKA